MLLTQSELAQRLGITVTTVSRWETGRVPVTPMAAQMIKLMADEPQLSGEEWNRRMEKDMTEREAALADEEKERGARWFDKH